MEYLENTYTPMVVVGIGFVAKKVFKKELVPVSGWKQMFTTYLTVLAAVMAGQTLKKEMQKRETPPKP